MEKNEILILTYKLKFINYFEEDRSLDEFLEKLIDKEYPNWYKDLIEYHWIKAN